jgi:hypothetical protein
MPRMQRPGHSTGERLRARGWRADPKTSYKGGMKRTPPRVLLDNDAATLTYHPTSKIVHHELKRFVRGDEFRQVLDLGLEEFRKHGATKWLSDDRKNGALTPADAEWATTDWAPRVIAAGWRSWAVVMPEKVAGQMNMRRWIDFYAEKGVTVRVFEEPDEGLAWLASREG